MGIKKIESNIEILKERLLEKKPERFSRQDIMRAFFGAMVIGITFIFTSGLIQIVKDIRFENVVVIFIATIVFLIAEIYFIGWSRVRGESGRNVYEFTLKRLPTFYIISLIVSVIYTYIFGLNNFLSDGEITKLIIVMAMPCSIGAAMGDLLRKY